MSGDGEEPATKKQKSGVVGRGTTTPFEQGSRVTLYDTLGRNFDGVIYRVDKSVHCQGWDKYRPESWKGSEEDAYVVHGVDDLQDCILDWNEHPGESLPKSLASKYLRHRTDRPVSLVERVLQAIDSGSGKPKMDCELLNGNKLTSVLSGLHTSEHLIGKMEQVGINDEELKQGTIQLAYMFAVLVRTEMERFAQENITTKESDHLFEDSTSTPQKTFIDQTPSILRMFLFTLATVSVNPKIVKDPRTKDRNFIMNPGRNIDRTPYILRRLMSVVTTILKTIRQTGSTKNWNHLHDKITARLLLDRRGVSEALIRWLTKMGFCSPSKVGNSLIKSSSQTLSVQAVHPVYRGLYEQLALAMDNANVKTCGGMHNMVVMSTQGLGLWLNKEELTDMNDSIKPRLQKNTATKILFNDNDAESLIKFHLQYLYCALINVEKAQAIADKKQANLQKFSTKIGEKVWFKYKGDRLLSGTLDGIEGSNFHVWHANDAEVSTLYTLNMDALYENESDYSSTSIPIENADILAELKHVMAKHTLCEKSYGWICDVLTNAPASPKSCMEECLRRFKQHLTGDPRVCFASVDQEFHTPLIHKFFFEKEKVIPIAGGAHLLKCTSISMFKYYEHAFVKRIFEAAGLKDSFYTKIMNGQNIKLGNKACIGMHHAFMTALVESYKEAQPDSYSSLRDKLNKECLMSVKAPVDSHGRPFPELFPEANLEHMTELREWAYAKAGGKELGANVYLNGLYGKYVPFKYHFLRGIEHGDYGEEPGADTLILKYGIQTGSRPSLALKREKLYAYKSALDKGANVEGAKAKADAITKADIDKLPAIPVGGNVNLKILLDFLFEAMPSWLAIYQSTRIRSNDINGDVKKRMLVECTHCKNSTVDGCRCTHRHLWLIGLKGQQRSAFSRRQPKYQRLLISELALIESILQTDELEVVVNMVACIESMFALSVDGDNYNCEALDLFTERMVKILKDVALRKPSDGAGTTDRARTKSFTLMLESIRKEFDKTKTKVHKFPSRETEVDRNREKAFLRMAKAIVKTIFAADDNSTLAVTPEMKVNNPRHAYFAFDIAARRSVEVAHVILSGLNEGFSALYPKSTHPPLSYVHVVPKKKKNKSEKLHPSISKAQHQQRVKMFADSNSVPLNHNADMFEGATEGNTKSQLALLLLQEYGATIAFHYFKSNKDKDEYYRNLDPADKKKIVIIDFLMLVHAHPTLRAKGIDITVVEIARALLILGASYCTDSTVCIVLCIDCPRYMTWLRVLQQIKRLKFQAPSDIQAAQHSEQDNTATSKLYGSDFFSLMSSKEGGLQRVVEEMKFQMANKSNAESEKSGVPWDFQSYLKKGAGFAVVGGDVKEADVVIKGTGRTKKLKIGSKWYTAVELSDAMKGLMNQGEGEGMIFGATHNLIKLFREQSSSAIFELLCHDADALCGRAMPCITRLKHLCGEIGADFDKLNIHLQIHSKNADVLQRMGISLKSKMKTRVCPDGRSLVTVSDLCALWSELEKDVRLVGGGTEPGTKAIAVTTALLSLTDNDMLANMKGLSSKKVFKALVSTHYQQLTEKFGHLIEVFEDGKGTSSETYRLKYEGLLNLFYVAAIQRSGTYKYLLCRYSEEEIMSIDSPLPYYVTEAAALAADQTLPSPAAVLCRMSNVKLVFNMLACWNALPDPRPATLESEIYGSSFVNGKDGLKCTHIPMHFGERNSQIAATKMRRQFGNAWIDMEDTADNFPFGTPRQVMKEAVSVDGSWIPRKCTTSKILTSKILMNVEDVISMANSLRQQEAVMNAKEFKGIMMNTLAYHTQFKLKGQGRPQLLSAKVSDVQTLGKEWQTSEVGDDTSTKYKDVLSTITGKKVTISTTENALRITEVTLRRVLLGAHVESSIEMQVSDDNADNSDTDEESNHSDNDSEVNSDNEIRGSDEDENYEHTQHDKYPSDEEDSELESSSSDDDTSELGRGKRKRVKYYKYGN